MPTRPLHLLLLACAGSAAFYAAAHWSQSATGGTGDEDETLTEALPHPGGGASAPDSARALAPRLVAPEPELLQSARSHAIPASAGDAFGTLSWLPPPPPPPPPAPPPPPVKPAPPTAPPLPFTFVGLLEHGAANPEAFLAKGDALLIASVGDMLENNAYRVESITPTQIVITYMPLHMAQTIDITGGAK